jgi:hypothetical protein
MVPLANRPLPPLPPPEGQPGPLLASIGSHSAHYLKNLRIMYP